MPVYILLIVLFLQNGPAVSISVTAPSDADCQSNLPLIMDNYRGSKFTLNGKEYNIEDVEGTCNRFSESI